MKERVSTNMSATDTLEKSSGVYKAIRDDGSKNENNSNKIVKPCSRLSTAGGHKNARKRKQP